MRNFLTTTIVIFAVFAVMMANNYSRGAPEKEYVKLYASENTRIVSSKEQDVVKEKIHEALTNEECEVEEFFIRVRNFNGPKISVVVLMNPSQIKIFDLKSDYTDSLYSLLKTGEPIFWLGDETEEFIKSCNFYIQNNEIVMKTEKEL